jgi:hypothetical protein
MILQLHLIIRLCLFRTYGVGSDYHPTHAYRSCSNTPLYCLLQRIRHRFGNFLDDFGILFSTLVRARAIICLMSNDGVTEALRNVSLGDSSRTMVSFIFGWPSSFPQLQNQLTKEPSSFKGSCGAPSSPKTIKRSPNIIKC